MDWFIPWAPQRAEQEGLNPDRNPRVCGSPKAASARTRKGREKEVVRDLPAEGQLKGRPSSLREGRMGQPAKGSRTGTRPNETMRRKTENRAAGTSKPREMKGFSTPATNGPDYRITRGDCQAGRRARGAQTPAGP